jgi:hypothetical protein
MLFMMHPHGTRPTRIVLAIALAMSLDLLIGPLSAPNGVAAGEPQANWILSGQSNACGRAKLPGPKPHSQVTMWDLEQGAFVQAEDPLPNMGTTGTGPWIVAANLVAEQSGEPLRLCGFASGGKPIAFWHPGQPGHQGLMPVIRDAGQGSEVFLWYQGESDTGGRLSGAQYLKELTEHVARVRDAAANPHMLVVVVQLGPSLRPGTGGYMAIREAQRQFVIQDAHAVLVPALGRTLMDTVHLDNAGYRELGREIGRAVLRVQHDKSQDAWPGPVLDAAVLVPDQKARTRNTVVAHFAEVRQLQHAEAADFAVLDAEGTNPCTALETGDTVMTLTCERDVIPPARLVYGYGQKPKASLTDEAGNRAPAVQQPITLGDPPADSISQVANGAGTAGE